MKIFAISDLHLSFQTNKPMDLFGDHWTDYEQRIMEDWNSRVTAGDVGIIAGDISWAMKMEDARLDFEFLAKLNGTKIIIRGNHDYWWKSISKIRETLDPTIFALQNDSIKIGEVVFAGTRGWKVPERRQAPARSAAQSKNPNFDIQAQETEDKKILQREIIRFELALKDARSKSPEGTLIAILHYPPFNSTRDDSSFTKLCERYNVTACVYGHLHGKQSRSELFIERNKVKYYLTSCDLMEHKLAEIEI